MNLASEERRNWLVGAPDRSTNAETVSAWLAEAGMADGASVAAVEPVSVVVLVVDEGGTISAWAVPDSAIPGAVRAALDGPWHQAFALEEIVEPGPLWLLALTGYGEPRVYGWLGPNHGIDPEVLVAAHDRWAPYAVTDLGALRGANVTRCYVAHLAM